MFQYDLAMVKLEFSENSEIANCIMQILQEHLRILYLLMVIRTLHESTLMKKKRKMEKEKKEAKKFKVNLMNALKV